MHIHRTLLAWTLLALTTGCALRPVATVGQAPETPGALFEQIAPLDAEVFSAFNNCAAPGQLERHPQRFSESVEFHHDNGGVTWNRADLIANGHRAP